MYLAAKIPAPQLSSCLMRFEWLIGVDATGPSQFANDVLERFSGAPLDKNGAIYACNVLALFQMFQ